MCKKIPAPRFVLESIVGARDPVFCLSRLFRDDDAAVKLLYLALKNFTKILGDEGAAMEVGVDQFAIPAIATSPLTPLLDYF